MKNLAVNEGDEVVIMDLKDEINNVRLTCISTSDELSIYIISDFGGYRNNSLKDLYNLAQNGLVKVKATTTPNGKPISTAGLYMVQCKNDETMTGAKLLVVR